MLFIGLHEATTVQRFERAFKVVQELVGQSGFPNSGCTTNSNKDNNSAVDFDMRQGRDIFGVGIDRNVRLARFCFSLYVGLIKVIRVILIRVI